MSFTCGTTDISVGAEGGVCLDLFNRRVFVWFGIVLTVEGAGTTSLTEGFYGPDGVLSGVIPIFNTLDGTTLNEHVFDLVGFEFNINGQDCPSSCTGGSRWILRRAECEDANVYMYYWELFDNDCDGQCFTASCVPAIPEEPELPPTPIDDATATTSGLIDYLPADPNDVQEEELVNGNCLCQEEYEATTCCTGTSTWTLEKLLCYSDGEDYFIYYWDFVSSDCGGPCVDDLETCREQPPATPVLPTDPVVADAELDLLVGLEDNTGVCNCLEAYVPPECPECTCEDVTANKMFTISSGPAFYQGTYTLVKGAGSCGDCCWYGVSDTNSVPAMLTWSGGLWLLDLDSTLATYEVVGEACDDPIVLNKTSGPFDFPATITI
jgi:hypothetical protein